jgi:type II secretory pathway pseudopilin PulG
MGTAKDNTLMYLQRQGGERGYAMAALLVTLAVMSVLMSAALPTWRHEAQREKEAELVFRGEQYARAVALFRVKNQNAFPPSIDVLVQGKFLRKKYLDPITGKDFDVIGVGSQTPTTPQQTGTARGATPAAPATPPAPATPSAFGSGGSTNVSGGIMGVHSKSTENSIRIYKGQTRYDQWNFVFTAMNRPGGNDPGALNPGGRGGAGLPGPNGGRGVVPGAGTGRGGRSTPPGRGPGGFGPVSDSPPLGLPSGRSGAGS